MIRGVHRETPGISRGDALLAHDRPEPARHSPALEVVCDEQMVEMPVVAHADEADDAAARFRDVVAKTLRNEPPDVRLVVLRQEELARARRELVRNVLTCERSEKRSHRWDVPSRHRSDRIL